MVEEEVQQMVEVLVGRKMVVVMMAIMVMLVVEEVELILV